jgi:hypothetical protein
MSKMRMFKFWNEAGDEKEKEEMSLKKAVKSVQGDFKDKFIGVEYISKKGKKIISSLKWIALFAFIYILLLPLGGYRPYRSNILRFDTVMPITICLFYIYGLSTLFLLENITKRKSMYYAAIITFSLIFTYADHSTLNENECEKQALMTIANSEDQIVPDRKRPLRTKSKKTT